MTERVVDPPYVKDYDAVEGPTSWPTRFDISRWRLIAARVDGRRVGGAAIAFDTLGVRMLGGRRDVALLWDLRVAPDLRGRGVGTALFRAAERWAEDKVAWRSRWRRKTSTSPHAGSTLAWAAASVPSSDRLSRASERGSVCGTSGSGGMTRTPPIRTFGATTPSGEHRGQTRRSAGRCAARARALCRGGRVADEGRRRQA
jgi:GNAT superfamily N-acetyltransferase